MKSFFYSGLPLAACLWRGSCIPVSTMRRDTHPPVPGRAYAQRGVTLIELLVALAIFLMVFAMAGLFIGPPIKRARLSGAATDLEILAKRVPVQSRTQRSGEGLFVFLRADPASRTFDLVADTNPAPAGDGRFQDPSGGGTTDSLVADVPTFRLPDGIVFHDLAAPYGGSWAGWGAAGSVFALGIDYQGRTILPVGGQIAAPAVIHLTHADMVAGTLRPFVVHRIAISPVWAVRQTRLVRDPAAATGWREF